MSARAETVPIGTGPRLRVPRRIGARALLPALGLSALIHAILFVTIRFDNPVEMRTLAPPPLPLVKVVEAMQAFDIAVVPGDVASIEIQVRARQDIIPTVPVPIVPPGVVEGIEQPGNAPREDPQPLQRLEYRRADVDVWKPPPEVPLEVVAPDAVMRQRIADRIAALNDSSAAAAAAAARATDWTVKDADGGRWGVSPGQIHLGSVTLPLPFAFSPPPGRRDEIAGRMRTWRETQAQASRAEAAETFDARVKAMREREEERRRRAAGDTIR